MRLFRAVSQTELDDIRSHHGAFHDSRNLSGKGFFFELGSALRFARWASMDDGQAYMIVETAASDAMIARGTPHAALKEGAGVYLRQSELDLLSPALEVQS